MSKKEKKKRPNGGYLWTYRLYELPVNVWFQVRKGISNPTVTCRYLNLNFGNDFRFKGVVNNGETYVFALRKHSNSVYPGRIPMNCDKPASLEFVQQNPYELVKAKQPKKPNKGTKYERMLSQVTKPGQWYLLAQWDRSPSVNYLVERWAAKYEIVLQNERCLVEGVRCKKWRLYAKLRESTAIKNVKKEI